MIKFVGEWQELEELGFEFDELTNCYTTHLYNAIYLDVDIESGLLKIYAGIEKRSCYNLDVFFILFQLNLIEMVGNKLE